MTRHTVTWTLKSVKTPFYHTFSQIWYTIFFLATNYTGLSDLLSEQGLARSHGIKDLFLG